MPNFFKYQNDINIALTMALLQLRLIIECYGNSKIKYHTKFTKL